MSNLSLFHRASLLAVACIVASWPAAADWLVDRDGQRIETRGPWKVQRSSVVFTAANGSLLSLRLADVDLEASEQATAAAVAKPAVAAETNARGRTEPVRRAPVLVLTTADVGRAAPPPVDDSVEDQETAAELADSEPKSSPAAAPPIEVISWRSKTRGGAGGLEILGTLRNDSPSIVTGAGVHVRLFDHDGEEIARRDAFLDTLSIAGRATIGFRALFPDVEVFDGEPVFEVRAQELALSTPAQDRRDDSDLDFDSD